MATLENHRRVLLGSDFSWYWTNENRVKFEVAAQVHIDWKLNQILEELLFSFHDFEKLLELGNAEGSNFKSHEETTFFAESFDFTEIPNEGLSEMVPMHVICQIFVLCVFQLIYIC